MGVLQGKAVLLAVTGGIAAYKSADLARMIRADGAEVRVVMTEAATRFITPLTFQSLTQNPVVTDLWSPPDPGLISHVALADWAEAVVIAPATANIIGKMAAGIADDFLSTCLLAVQAPIVVCPAMNVNMYEHPIVQENLTRLRTYNYRVVEPGTGGLACGWQGRGRLAALEDILEAVRAALAPQDLTGLRVLVTAGPTREPWDDVRFLSNRSSGRMGLALARTARRRGAEVVLVTGPTSLEPPSGIRTIKVETTLEMQEAVRGRLDQTDILVKAAAPGDFRPAQKKQGKIKKTGDPGPIELRRNPDILAEIGADKGDLILVGFAAETEDLVENARAKLKAKNLDLIVANQVGAPGAAFGAETNQVTLLDAQGRAEELPLLSKEDVAGLIWDRIAALVRQRRG